MNLLLTIMRPGMLTGATFLAACTTTVTREGTPSAQAERDIAECRYEASRASPENPLIAHDLAGQCLRLRGYRTR